MPKENKYYRDVLEDILTTFGGKKCLSLKDVSSYVGLDPRTVKKVKLPLQKIGNTYLISAPALARWLTIKNI